MGLSLDVGRWSLVREWLVGRIAMRRDMNSPLSNIGYASAENWLLKTAVWEWLVRRIAMRRYNVLPGSAERMRSSGAITRRCDGDRLRQHRGRGRR